MLLTIPVTFDKQDASDADLELIRADAGNPALTVDDVVIYKRSMIARTDVTANGSRFTKGALVHAAPTFIGKPVNFDHSHKEASKQIARIYDAYTQDIGESTFLYVKSYSIKTDSDKDLQMKLSNRQHREQSMGIEVGKATCDKCQTDVTATGICPEHGSDADYTYTISEFSGHHLAYVGDPAVEGAGVLTHSKQDEIDPETLKLAEDGKAFRVWASDEFGKWYSLNNADTTDEEITTLCGKLSAKEMVRLSRVEQSRFSEIIPDGGQQLEAPKDDDTEIEMERTEAEILQSFSKEKK